MNADPIVELRRTYRFCASHRVARSDWSEARNIEVYGPASYVSGHGHNYRLTLVLAGAPDPETRRVVDLEALDRAVEDAVLLPFDHKNLNADVPSLAGEVPTSEVLVMDIWKRVAPRIPGGVLREVILETDEFLAARYRGPGDTV
jgi:6-pyruvoyltetrahydropterin/6-carboxytetrahydropterin synthase